jgi:riboflavin synthase
MFTGIIENLGKVVSINKKMSNLIFEISTPFINELKIDQSIAHNGICLTVTHLNATTYFVTAIEETINKSQIGSWQVGDTINLERCMPATGRFDGHIVQGHVDEVATCINIEDKNGSWLFTFQYENKNNITVEKGSITVNGISLTVVNSQSNKFSVAIIPYTYQHTNLGLLKVSGKVNLEFDILGKYIKKILTQ